MIEPMVDFSSVITALSAISSISVIVGAVFVVFQLRQNSKLITASVQENKATILVALLDKITNETLQGVANLCMISSRNTQR